MHRRHILRLILLLIAAYLAYAILNPRLAHRARLATEHRLKQTVIPTLESHGSPLHAVLTQLESATGIPVETRWQTLDPLGVTRDTAVYARLRNIRADKAFLIILDMVDNRGSAAAWVEDGGGRIIVANLAGSPSRRPCWEVYDLFGFFRGLPPEPSAPERVDAAESLLSLITQTVDPASWRERGGTLGACHLYGDRMLVLQAEENHRQLANLLTQLKQSELTRLDHRLRDKPWPRRWRLAGFGFNLGTPGALGSPGKGFLMFVFPHWLPALLLAAYPAGTWWRWRRGRQWSKAGRCAGCGYDLIPFPKPVTAMIPDEPRQLRQPTPRP